MSVTIHMVSRRSHCLALLLVPALTLAGLACGPPAPESFPDELAAAWENRVERPDIVLILIDTLRKDRLGFYGNERDTSPNLDRLASRSVVYENAFSQAPWTTPSVASLLTSQHSSTLGIRGIRERLPASTVFLQEILSDHGYATHAVVSHSFLGSQWGFGAGFDSFESLAAGHRTITSADVTDAALEFVDGFGDRPSFLLVHYFDAHYLYMEHEEHRFADEPPMKETEWWLQAFRHLRYDAHRGRLSPEQRDYLLALYDSEIAFADHHIGRLLDRLEEKGVLDNGIVIFTADHGEEFLDHGNVGHGITLYNELINIPLTISWPGSREQVRSTRPVAHIDLMPTLLDYLDIPIEHPIEGMRIQQRGATTPIFSETHWRRNMVSVIQGDDKMIWDLRRDRLALYDLEADPLEASRLREPQSNEDLLTTLRAFVKRPQSKNRGKANEQVELTPEELEKLRALGYVD